MDRQTVYAGQLPQDTDVLLAQRNAMVGLAKLAAAVLGQTSIVSGFAVTPTGPASLNIIVGQGEIYQLENLEQSVWGSLAADTHTILKQGINLDPVTMGIVPPSTVGYSQNFLVEVQYADLDTGATVLPYFNAFDSTHPFSGPANAGTAQNTVRKGVAAIQIKAGIAAPTGTQATPTQDAGWTGVYYVVVANGATTITSGNINVVIGAPTIPATLPNIPVGVQDAVWVGSQDTGTANAMVAAFSPAITALVPRMTVIVKKIASANTGAVTLDIGTGANAVKRTGGAALTSGDLPASSIVMLTWDGGAWQITNFQGFNATSTTVNNFVTTIPYAVDTGPSSNNIAAAFSPTITTLTAGLTVEVKLLHDITGAAFFQADSTGVKSVIRKWDLLPTGPGDAITGSVVELTYDGTNWQIMSKTSAKISYFFIGTFGTFNWTCPPGVYAVKATVIGGGGGGGSTAQFQLVWGACGGGGGYSEGIFPVVPGTVYGITTGAGGAGQTSTGGGNGGNGGTSSFSAFCSATGGTGGKGSGSPNLQGGFSGVGSGGYNNSGLGDGSTGGQLSAIIALAPGCGGGPGGQAGTGSGNPGFPGRGPGGGGGGTAGCEFGSAGGNGAAGSVKLEWWI
jgi:hypothetical protein